MPFKTNLHMLVTIQIKEFLSCEIVFTHRQINSTFVKKNCKSGNFDGLDASCARNELYFFLLNGQNCTLYVEMILPSLSSSIEIEFRNQVCKSSLSIGQNKSTPKCGWPSMTFFSSVYKKMIGLTSSCRKSIHTTIALFFYSSQNVLG